MIIEIVGHPSCQSSDGLHLLSLLKLCLQISSLGNVPSDRLKAKGNTSGVKNHSAVNFQSDFSAILRQSFPLKWQYFLVFEMLLNQLLKRMPLTWRDELDEIG